MPIRVHVRAGRVVAQFTERLFRGLLLIFRRLVDVAEADQMLKQFPRLIRVEMGFGRMSTVLAVGIVPRAVYSKNIQAPRLRVFAYGLDIILLAT